ncbi:MAG: YHS domain-containing protein [Balneola sp.]|nr:YHS domain-containing protein [Balneola sp.]
MAHHETCPVSGMAIADPTSAPQVEYKGQSIYFCCSSCQDSFLKNPEQYLSGNAPHTHCGRCQH